MKCTLRAVRSIGIIILIIAQVFQPFAAKAQSLSVVKGIVHGDNNLPLVNASVIIRNNKTNFTTGAKTDSAGVFTVQVPAGGPYEFRISNVGYEQQTLSGYNLKEGTMFQLDVPMKLTAGTLDQVVVVGYGTRKKSDLISSVASIKPENATKNVTLDLGEMLRGKAAGVMVTTSDAGPGGSSNILIRGRSSISGGTNPIVIADGVRIGSINDLNPNDIASIEILKDAAAQAIYGARASNGVILITTKRGVNGKLTINYDGYYGIQTAKRNFDVYSGPEFAQLKREADRAVNKNILRPDAVIFSADELAAISENRTIDWAKEVLRPAQIQNHNLSFSSGTDRTKLYVGGNYQNMTGIVPTTNI